MEDIEETIESKDDDTTPLGDLISEMGMDIIVENSRLLAEISV